MYTYDSTTHINLIFWQLHAHTQKDTGVVSCLAQHKVLAIMIEDEMQLYFKLAHTIANIALSIFVS